MELMWMKGSFSCKSRISGHQALLLLKNSLLCTSLHWIIFWLNMSHVQPAEANLQFTSQSCQLCKSEGKHSDYCDSALETSS